MGALFRYDRERLDERLVHWWNTERSPQVARVGLLDTEPGFSAHDLVGGKPIHGNGFGPVTQHLQALAYWLFVNPQGVLHPDHGSSPKSVGGGRAHLFPNGSGATYLTAWSSYEPGPVMIPFPHIDDLLLGKRTGSFADARRALHEAAIACADRVNLIWPSALALSVNGDET